MAAKTPKPEPEISEELVREVLDSLGDEELLDEVKARDLDRDTIYEELDLKTAPELDASAVYEMLSSGHQDRAMQIVRDYVQDATGRILP